MRTITVLLMLALLASCRTPGGSADPTDGPPDGETPVLVIAEGGPGDGPGLSVADALTHGPTDDLVTVIGALFVDAGGTVRLCDAILESFPPQCGGARIEVHGLDLDTIPTLETEGDLSWAEGVTLFGSVD
jgi:hypothetical protein